LVKQILGKGVNIIFMSSIELSLDTTNEAVDWVYTLLANAIAIEDIHISEYSDLHNANWTFTIQMYLPEGGQIYQRIDEIAAILKPLHRTGLTTELRTFVVEQKPEVVKKSEDYLNNSCDNSLVRRIGDRFVIVSPSSNYQPQNPQEIILRLQNSLAFGTGLHPATILSLQLLERHIKPDLNTLDLGSGSGILSVAMAKLGAKVLAIDNDPIAVTATQEAVILNQVNEQVSVTCGSLGVASQFGHWMGGDNIDHVPEIQADKQFDLIVANIFARVHISLANDFYKALRNTSTHSGILITSGYTRDREEDITKAMIAVGFAVGDRAQIDEWMAIAYCA
jgi:ribosomal protein L11 methyltransferase